MPYPLRPDVPGATYHVNSQGTNKETIFLDDHDRESFLVHLDRAAARQGWMVLAHCLMTTHYHLVLTVPRGGLSEGMRLLNRGYSFRTNQRHGRTMHLFRQRFFSVGVDTDSHLLEACRYVVLNPVRARMCERPEEWRWSSYRATAGLSASLSFLALDEVLGRFGDDRRRAQAVYRRFVQDGLDQVSDTDGELARDDPFRA